MCDCQAWPGVYVCSLLTDADRDGPQPVQRGVWTTIRFPFGSRESDDDHGMHNALQPDGVTTTFEHDRAGLIWPARYGWGTLYAKANWNNSDTTQLLGRFIRDPLGVGDGKVNDWTATQGDAPTPGKEHRTYSWGIVVHPDTPLAFQVTTYASQPVDVVHAQFKLVISQKAEAA